MNWPCALLLGLLLPLGAALTSPCESVFQEMDHVGTVSVSMVSGQTLSSPAPGFLCRSRRDNVEDYLKHTYYEFKTMNDPSKWVDISTTGTRSFVSDVDDTPSQSLKLGFTFPFFGHPHNSILINSNGFLGLDIETTCEGYGFCSWGPESLVRHISPYQTDFDGAILNNTLVSYFEDTANSRLIVQWENTALWNSTGENKYTFQVVLHKNGDFEFNYKSIPVHANMIKNDVRKRNYPLFVGLSSAALVEVGDYYVLNSYKPFEISTASVQDGFNIYITAKPTCLDYSGSCSSCLESAEKETGIKCNWCPSSKLCLDGMGETIGQKGGSCPVKGLSQATQCPNIPGRIAGGVIGGVVGLALLAVGLFFFIRWARGIRSELYKYRKLHQQGDVPLAEQPQASS